MPEPANTLLIEGSFEELAEELAQYLDNVKKTPAQQQQQQQQQQQSEEVGSSSLHGEVMRLLETNQKDEVLKRLVTTSTSLNSAPEKEFTQAYNLLVHLVRQSPNINMFLPRICANLSQPISSSPMNGAGMALSILSTIFNILQPDNDTRFHVFLAILSVVKNHGMYEVLRPQLKNLDRWIAEWESDEEDQQKLFLEIANVAEDAGEDEESYLYLLRALRTIPPNEASTPSARQLALRAVTSALSHPAHFDFQDLTALDAIQALRKSDATHWDLLEIFNAKLLDDYDDFVSSLSTTDNGNGNGNNWLESNHLSPTILRRKIRLLTLASLAANTPTRSLPYAQIAGALQIPADEVEMWVIDVVRAGLVEGKLSQLNQTFLIHRSTYRVFGERQWKEVGARLNVWRESLRNVLGVLREGREGGGRFLAGGGGGGGGGGVGDRREGIQGQVHGQGQGMMVGGGGGGGRRGGGRENNMGGGDAGYD
ncbi:MAG: hypothetical protein M1816_003043 [Peltula sp. TS41687]|nr:MAG: hypothetical protein M1816_003043 [Peltula sp. TS41687]